MGNKLLAMLRRPKRTVLISALVIMLCVLAFAAIADRVSEGKAFKFDDRVLMSLRHSDNPAMLIGPQWTGLAARDVSSLGAEPGLILLVAIVAGFLLLAGKRRDMWVILLAFGSGALMKGVLKAAFTRPRPNVVPCLEAVSSYAFPSAHSMLSAIVYLTLGAMIASVLTQRRLRIYVLMAATLVTFLVGVSRVMLGVHYPTDVLAGWAAGTAWALLWQLFGRVLGTPRVPQGHNFHR